MTLVQVNTHAYQEALAYTDWNAAAGDLNQIVDAGAGFVPGKYLLWDSIDAGVTLPAASVTTPSLDQGFKHLLVIWKARSAYAANTDSLNLRVNGGSTASYYDEILQGVSNAASAAAAAAQTSARIGTVAGANVSSTYTGVGALWLPHYTETTAYKNWVCISGAFYGVTSGQGYAQTIAGFYGSGGAVTTLTFLAASGNLVVPSRITVYGC